ncbi:uncharacterized protein LOC120154085 [Hibiscus syriacus]|uniref:uncharacterized protein LOC120154085 n=1 Tax=Hibiscus syriacus TaxID=106335 RepID=UPI0019243117|nr:uncharacterized protein LOC120154085 [Hibiscus syriacus]
MAVVSTPPSKIEEVNRTKESGIRTSESGNGKTCHQCRQKRINLLAPCKNVKKDKQCTIKYCQKCLLNRYGEKEDVALLADWKCPKCRGICNCSMCMKKKGHNPTGVLVFTAKKTGISSVSELLQAKGPENFKYERIVNDMGVSAKKQTKESVATSLRKLGKENSFDGDCDSKVSSQNLISSLPEEKMSKKMKREGLKELYSDNGDHEASLNEASNKTMKASSSLSDGKGLKTEIQIDDASSPSKEQKTKCAKSKKSGVLNGVKVLEITKKRKSTTSDEDSRGSNDFENDNTICKLQSVLKPCKDRKLDVDIQLPEGTSLITVAGVDLPPNDVGHALQFLEFCAAFGEVLDMKKGQAESVIREIIRGRGRCRLQYSPVVQIHIQLLSLLQKDTGKKYKSLPLTAELCSLHNWLLGH